MATIIITDEDNWIINNEFNYILWFQPSLWCIILKKHSIDIILDSRYFDKKDSIDLENIKNKSWKEKILFIKSSWKLTDSIIHNTHDSKTRKVEENITLKYFTELQKKSKNKLEIITPYFEEKRVIKQSNEQDKIRKAIKIIDSVFFAIQDLEKSWTLIWKTEKELRVFIVNKILEFWWSAESFEAIVAFWKNSATPHHTAWNTLISDWPLLIDMGAIFDWYCSDFTRTFWVWEKNDSYHEFQKIYNMVAEAHKKAFQIAQPWLNASLIDTTARNSIIEDGYGEYFTHSTWHWVGLNIHEAPWITKNSKDIIKTWMVFTIEPGIYLPWKFWVRIENIVFAWENWVEGFSKVEF